MVRLQAAKRGLDALADGIPVPAAKLWAPMGATLRDQNEIVPTMGEVIADSCFGLTVAAAGVDHPDAGVQDAVQQLLRALFIEFRRAQLSAAQCQLRQLEGCAAQRDLLHDPISLLISCGCLERGR